MLAAFLHLSYLPGLLGIALAIGVPSWKTVILPLTAFWLICLVGGLLFEPKNEQVGKHLYEARRYHVQGFVAIGLAFLILFASGMVTWGVGSALALLMLPAALLVYMIPTFVGSFKALRGEPYEYDAPWEDWLAHFSPTRRQPGPSHTMAR
jgi:hypothetical protein